MKNTACLVLMTLLSFLMLGCQSQPSKSDDSLFVQLGGKEGIAELAGGLINEIIVDRRIERYFEKTDLDRLHEKLVEQICELAGGPCTYEGDSMKAVHTGLEIGEGDFNALVEGLIQAMDDSEVPVAAQNRLLALLAPMRADIIHQ